MRDCAPCHFHSDGYAGKRYANLILIDRPDRGFLNSRRTERWGSLPPPDPPWMFPTLAGGCPVAPSTRNPLGLPRPGSVLSRYSAVTTCFGGFGLGRAHPEARASPARGLAISDPAMHNVAGLGDTPHTRLGTVSGRGNFTAGRRRYEQHDSQA